MRNPKKRRDISCVVTAIAAATLSMTAAQHKGDTLDDAWFGILIASFFATVFSAIAWGVFQLATSRQAKLLRGDDRLAQWNVSATEWEQFLNDEEIRRKAGRANTIRVHKLDASSGIDVVISRKSLMVGDDFYHLAEQVALQWLPEMPPCLEFNMVTVSKSGRVHWNIRFPVTPSAEAQARVVWDYMHSSRPKHDPVKLHRFHVRARNVGLVAVVPSTMALVFAYMFLNNESLQNAARICLILGGFTLSLGLIVAGLMQLFIRSAPPAEQSSHDN